MINLAVGWIAMAILPVGSYSYAYESELERVVKKFLSQFDWSKVFMVICISSLFTLALWLILSSYGKLPSGDNSQSGSGEEK